MKNSLFLILILAVFITCKKDEDPTPDDLIVVIPADFRDSIVGSYVGTKNNYFWMMGLPPTQIVI